MCGKRTNITVIKKQMTRISELSDYYLNIKKSGCSAILQTNYICENLTTNLGHVIPDHEVSQTLPLTGFEVIRTMFPCPQRVLRLLVVLLYMFCISYESFGEIFK